tara:strand:- start:791 stop:970 length:180 start_codon:yes stop_codon:yes gene_type:complete
MGIKFKMKREAVLLERYKRLNSEIRSLRKDPVANRKAIDKLVIKKGKLRRRKNFPIGRI